MEYTGVYPEEEVYPPTPLYFFASKSLTAIILSKLKLSLLILEDSWSKVYDRTILIKYFVHIIYFVLH